MTYVTVEVHHPCVCTKPCTVGYEDLSRTGTDSRYPALWFRSSIFQRLGSHRNPANQLRPLVGLYLRNVTDGMRSLQIPTLQRKHIAAKTLLAVLPAWLSTHARYNENVNSGAPFDERVAAVRRLRRDNSSTLQTASENPPLVALVAAVKKTKIAGDFALRVIVLFSLEGRAPLA